MPVRLFAHYQFLPVGQGLFATGQLALLPKGSAPNYRWVHDCGSTVTGPGSALEREALRYRGELKGERVNLLIISHFDNDHISGLATALKGVGIDRIVLPRVAPEIRLALAVAGASKPPTAASVRVLLNPTTAIRALLDAQNVPITYIDEDTDESAFPPLGKDGAPRDNPAPLNPDNDEALNEANVSTRPSGPMVAIVDRWEFCFYNRPTPLINPGVLAQVRLLLRFYRRGSISLEGLVAFLKLVYETALGLKDKVAHNNISLITYSGPISPTEIHESVARVFRAETGPRAAAWARHEPNGRLAVLYTGDVTLRVKFSKVLRDKLSLPPSRWDQIGTFQVPHHGSKYSWKVPTLAGWGHRWSIFSAEPTEGSTYHPHDEVWREFTAHGPLLVNKDQGVGINGYAVWRP